MDKFLILPKEKYIFTINNIFLNDLVNYSIYNQLL